MDSKLVWIGLASGAFAFLGSLGSALILWLSNLKTKRMELVYARKADIYKYFFERAGAFATDHSSPEKYAEFIHAYYATLIIASPDVLEAFDAEDNITSIASLLHKSADDRNPRPELNLLWSDVMNTLANTMRRDIQRFSRH